MEKERYCPKCFKKFGEGASRCPEHDIPLVSFAERDLVGRTLDERYKIQGIVGRGGMGIVYQAEQFLIERTVALKVLHPAVVRSETHLRRFLREAQAMASLKNPHTVTLHDFGASPEGLLYYTMELLDGRPMSQLIREEAPLDWPRAVDLILQCCESLEEAHDRQILHRDIKPDNLFVVREEKDEREFLKVLDFGIAKVLGDPSVEKLTQTGLAIGTPAYVSPEQILSKPAGPASDLYSVAVVFFEMLTGETPFPGSTPMEIILKHLNEQPRSMSEANPGVDVPEALQQVVAEAMAKDPRARPGSAEQLRNSILEATRCKTERFAPAQDGQHAESGLTTSSEAPTAIALEDTAAAEDENAPAWQKMPDAAPASPGPTIQKGLRWSVVWRIVAASAMVLVATSAVVVFLAVFDEMWGAETAPVMRRPVTEEPPATKIIKISPSPKGGLADGGSGEPRTRENLQFRRVVMGVRVESLSRLQERAERLCAGQDESLGELGILQEDATALSQGLTATVSAESVPELHRAAQILTDLEMAYPSSWFAFREKELRRIARYCHGRRQIQTDEAPAAGALPNIAAEAPAKSPAAGSGKKKKEPRPAPKQPGPKKEKRPRPSKAGGGSTRTGTDDRTSQAWLGIKDKWVLMDGRIEILREEMERVTRGCEGRPGMAAQVSGLKSVLRALDSKLAKLKRDVESRENVAEATDELVKLSERYDSQKEWFLETVEKLDSSCRLTPAKGGEDAPQSVIAPQSMVTDEPAK